MDTAAASLPPVPENVRRARAREYERRHNWLFLWEVLFTGAALVVFLMSGLSRWLAAACEVVSSNPWISITLYVGVVGIAQALLMLPLHYYGGFFLERRYELSRQTWVGWAKDRMKSLLLNLSLGVLIVNVVYFLLRRQPERWWVGAGLFLFLFGIVLTNLFPVLILPLFYKLKPLQDPVLTERLSKLAERAGARVLGIFRLELSEKTRKANAALAGLGPTKRILLGDTLLANFSPEEIEVVLAHELAHHKHRDLWRMLVLGAITTFAGLWLVHQVLRALTERLGFAGPADIAAFPLLALVFFLYALVTMPLSNGFSRWREYAADAFAVRLTENIPAFVSAMRKLAEQNLADPSPPAWIEWLLHDHPSLAKRIAAVEASL